MKRKEIIVVIVLFALALGFSWAFNNYYNNLNEVCFEENCFVVEIVDSVEERQQGLMFRESLDRDKGMLFIFEQSGVYAFWMKNTLIPLDIIWINSEKEIVFIAKDAQPCEADEACQSINPGKEALYVLEVNAGVTTEINLEVGDKLDF